ncbi:hypothetical protein ES705_24995 [subsurface metagenome]
MATSERLLTHVAEDLGVSKDELLAESLLEYLKSKKRDCMAEKLEILSRYRNISSPKELEEAIKNGSVAEHPSWEDLIVIENIEEKIKRLDKEIENIENLPGT